jgi:hypothetical protein
MTLPPAARSARAQQRDHEAQRLRPRSGHRVRQPVDEPPGVRIVSHRPPRLVVPTRLNVAGPANLWLLEMSPPIPRRTRPSAPRRRAPRPPPVGRGPPPPPRDKIRL